MSVIFRNAPLRVVLNEAIANKCRVLLVKDHGVYFMPQVGERDANGTYKNVAYAVGFHPGVDAFEDWWNRATDEFGGDDFGEYMEPQGNIFDRILSSTDDLQVSASPTRLYMQIIAAAPKDR